MLNIKALLSKLTRAIGSEPLLMAYANLIEDQHYYYGNWTQRAGRIACGISSDGSTCWMVNYVQPYNTTYRYGCYLVESYATYSIETGKTTASTSGGVYYGYTDYADMTASEKQFLLVLQTSPDNLMGGFTTSGSYTNLLKAAWGTYVSSSATAQINAQITVGAGGTGRFYTSNRSTAQTGNSYGIFMYGVSLWGKSS